MAQQLADNKKDNKKKRRIGPIVIFSGLGLGILYLLFGFFGIQAAFTNTTVAEAGPIFESGAELAAGEDSGEITTLAAGQFSGLSNYTVQGTASILTDGTDQQFLRLENFQSNNGPDLKVVLRADNGDVINLGPLKGNIGDQNYELPPGIDLSEYNSVEIYCERFSVTFGTASLNV